MLPDNALKNFVVGVSDLAPPPPYGTNLETLHYRRCNQYRGLPPSRPLTVGCLHGAIGRYVYVYLPFSRRRMTICEFLVYGTRKSGTAKKSMGFHKRLFRSISNIYDVPSFIIWPFSVLNPNQRLKKSFLWNQMKWESLWYLNGLCCVFGMRVCWKKLHCFEKNGC